MASKNANAFQNTLLDELNEPQTEDLDFDILEEKLQEQLEKEFAELQFLEDEKAKIGDPDYLGNVIIDVVWEQFMNQVAITAGEDFIKENNGLHLDLGNSAHIQTAENFDKGKIATHNYISREQLEQNYDRYSNKAHSEFRKEYVNPGMNATLKRAGQLYKQGVETVTDIYTGEQIPTKTKLENGKNNPSAAQREHVKSSAELYANPSLQMANSNEALAEIINNPENLQGYTTAERNNRKSDSSASEMSDEDKTKRWKISDERAEKFIKQKEKEGEDRLKEEGKKTQKEEAFRVSGKVLRALLMQLLAGFVREIIAKLVNWFKSAKRTLGALLDSLKDAIHSFIGKMKTHLINARNTVFTTVATAIWGPIVGTVKKVFMLLQQGWNSLKKAVEYIKAPANKGKSIGILLMEVGKIVIAGLTGAGSLLLGEVIEKSLMAIPIFAFEIPLLGSLANILGIFFGAVIAGIIGAIAINLLDKLIANTRKKEILSSTMQTGNKIISKQHQVQIVNEAQLERNKKKTQAGIYERHQAATSIMKNAYRTIMEDFAEDISEGVEPSSIDEQDIVTNRKIEKASKQLDGLLLSLTEGE